MAIFSCILFQETRKYCIWITRINSWFHFRNKEHLRNCFEVTISSFETVHHRKNFFFFSPTDFEQHRTQVVGHEMWISNYMFFHASPLCTWARKPDLRRSNEHSPCRTQLYTQTGYRKHFYLQNRTALVYEFNNILLFLGTLYGSFPLVVIPACLTSLHSLSCAKMKWKRNQTRHYRIQSCLTYEEI